MHHRAELVALPGGSCLLGDGDAWLDPRDREPRRRVTIEPFAIASTSVTNADFTEFVGTTGHVTSAERFGWSFVFGGLLPADFPETRGVAAAPWWRQVLGASWQHPEGPHSNVADRPDHPVVHVSHDDAVAYCAWTGTRLPSEAEWEHAAGGGADTVFPWGDELVPAGGHRMNVFQGTFPTHDTGDDGWVGTCPVTAFEPNVYGLFNMLGNVWEWTADWLVAGESRVQKGGSYLCHESHCRRYRPAARTGASPDSSAGNVGFRCAGRVGS